MIIFGLIFAGLMVLFGLGGTIFFDKLMYKTYNRVITGKEECIYRIVLLLIFALGLYLTALITLNIK